MLAADESRLILVVEDYPDAREMYEQMFSFAGHRVVTASNGEEALDRASNERPDVIVMDIGLPKVNGLTVIRILRSRPETKTTPIIALSATIGEHMRKAALDAGADVFCAKPCAPDDLEREIRTLLASHSADSR